MSEHVHFTAGNRAVSGDPAALAPSQTTTGNGAGPTVETGSAHTLRATLNVTAVAGTTPTLTVTLQTSADGVAWRTLQAFAAATAVGAQRLSVSGLDTFVRASWTTGGTTPSFTFSVVGELV